MSVQSELAEQCYQECDGDLDKAAALMVKRIKANNALFMELIDPFLYDHSRNLLRQVQRHTRKAVWEGEAPGRGRARMAALAQGTIATYMLFPLPDGTPLGKAERSVVIHWANHYLVQSADMGIKGRWLALIGEKMPARGHKRVEQVFTDEQLGALKASAEGKASTSTGSKKKPEDRPHA